MRAMRGDEDEPGADALARRLAAVHLGLAHAVDEVELLAAVVQGLPHAPDIVDLHYLEMDAAGLPIEIRPIALWTSGQPARPHPHREDRVRLDEDPLSIHWITAPDRPLLVSDIASDPRCDDALRARLAPRRALAVLPLRSEHPGCWQGIVTLRWAAPHLPGPEELLVYRLVMHSLAGVIADRRALAAHAAALAENEALYRLSTRISEAADPAELLAALVDETRSPAVQGKILAIETGPEGQPETLETIAIHGGDRTVGSAVGARIDLRDASVPLWTAHPNTALMVEDLATDPRLDPTARATHLANGLGAVIILPLRWHDRWLGFIQLGWTLPRRFGDDERRLFESIAPQAAAVLDNRLLVARSRQALAENRAQARTLEIVLDHLPIGVMILDVAGKRTLNRAGADLLADEEPDVRQPIPLYHPDSDEPVAPGERLSRLALAHGEVVSRERDLLGNDGVRRRLAVTAAPFRDEHGAILGTVTLFHDITPYVRAEREREQLKEAVIAAQRAALAERATPLIPISTEILVLPLVGAIDPERGDQLVDTVGNLEGHAGARVVLIDLTGVRDLDGPGALALVRAVAVLRLRGVAAIFTGIDDTVAWTLVDRDIDLRGLTTHATLRAGLAHAARQLAAPT